MSANRNILKKFRENDNSEIVSVLCSSLFAYIVLLYIAYILSFYSYWWVVALALPTHWLHARIFILMHDCGHYSFFKSRKLNTFFGHIAGFFYYTPFLMWRELHNKHHLYQGNLDKRGHSLDVWTMTKQEFQSSNAVVKILYKIYRHPFVILFISPIVLFFLVFRFPFEKFSGKAVANIFLFNVVLITAALYFPQIFLKYFLVQLPSLIISLSMASFLFYIQHQFEGTKWLEGNNHSNELISLNGSSYLKMSPFLDWCYGYIGYHHTHHFDTKIPMYHLKNASLHMESASNSVYLSSSLKNLNLKLWDTKSNKLVPF